MAQIVAHHDQLGAPRQRVRGVCVPHPVRARPAQLLGRPGPLFLDGIGYEHEEPPQHAREPRAFDAGGVPLEASHKRRRRVPARGRDRQAALHEILVKCRSCKRRQRHLAALAPFAGHVQPVIAVLVPADVCERRANQLASARARRIAEVQQNTADTEQGDIPMDYVIDVGAQVAKRFPAYETAGIASSWTGVYDVTPDWNPVLGTLPGISGLVVGYGFSGHGFKLSPTVGKILAQAALGQPTDVSLKPYSVELFATGELLTGKYGLGAVS
ncbi:hypothetical protein QF001_000443 [Paraburkholderia youngii]